MIVLLSPAKTLDFETDSSALPESQLLFSEEASYLAEKLKKFKPARLGKMMDISSNLAELNHQRYQQWSYPINGQGKQAAFAFKGDVYLGLQAEKFTAQQLEIAQERIIILSGLYGALRPLDVILPYRLEMGTEWAITPGKKNLYAYWKPKLTSYVKSRLKETGGTWILNLASQEYAKAVDFKSVKVPVITPEFKEEREGKFQMISFFAKKARGLMAAFAVSSGMKAPADLMAFDSEGYGFNEALSDTSKNKWVFTRKSQNHD